MKLDKMPDGQMLEGACIAYARAVQADIQLGAEGITIIDEGRIRKHPAVEISNRSWTLVKAFCSEFGFSPVSRLRLSPAGPDPGDEMDELVKMLSKSRNSALPESSLVQ